MDKYAVFGNPIEHSKSPQIHAEFARQTGQAMEYDRQLVARDDFSNAAKTFFAAGGKGLNITVPFKEEAYHFADQLTDRARAAQAVNTLALQGSGQILGDNTDGAGLVMDLTRYLGWQLRGKNILILGAGGAVRGVLLPLLAAAPKAITVANRTAAKAEELAKHFAEQGRIQGCGFDALQDICAPKDVDIIINGTSASLAGDLPPISSTYFSATTCVYDMVYGDQLTPFLKWAQDSGAGAISDGIGMLYGQAARKFQCLARCYADFYKGLMTYLA